MKRMSKKQKEAQIKLTRKRTKRNFKKKRKKKTRNRAKILNNHIKKNEQRSLSAPTRLSVIDNPNESIIFLNNIAAEIKKDMPIFIDMSRVEHITIDALLYLLAIIDNMKQNNIPYNIKGNAPSNAKAKKIFIASGFMNFVQSNSTVIPKTDDCIQIHCGEIIDPTIAKKLCDFVHKKIHLSRIETKKLYNIIIEIISNTKQHAYLSASRRSPRWYIYAYEEDNYISFSILDRGVGIIKTIQKKFHEKIDLIIGKNNTHNRLLWSALNGDFRTQTAERYRGNGLPEINKTSQDGYIKNLFVVSNLGFVNVGVTTIELRSSFKGTLFTWRLKK